MMCLSDDENERDLKGDNHVKQANYVDDDDDVDGDGEDDDSDGEDDDDGDNVEQQTSRATTMSSKPMLPPASSLSRHMKPRGPTCMSY